MPITATTNLTLGSLFDGIGVFPLAASKHGITPLWASEIEKAPISITKRHFPKMQHLGDITKLDGGKIPAVHVISFGSPCQNLSTAGWREGLAGTKSGLFFEAIRIIREMRDKTDGKFPAIAIWENVLGALFSSDKMDFRTVLESFAACDIPMPGFGRWADAGMVRGGESDVAWRVLDAQYWGSPPLAQRRRRIFLVADFTGRRAAEILFKPRGLFQDSAIRVDGGLSAAKRDRIHLIEAGRPVPIIHPFQERKMRGMVQAQDSKGFLQCFGKPTDPFPTLLAGTLTPFAYWKGNDYMNGVVRYETPTEREQLMGLPEGWTAFGHEGQRISDTARSFALGNAIALPCAEYIMAGISEALTN